MKTNCLRILFCTGLFLYSQLNILFHVEKAQIYIRKFFTCIFITLSSNDKLFFMNLRATNDRNRVKSRFMITCLILFFILPVSVRSQEGEDLFKKQCSVCHTIGGGKLVGPDLAGVTERREREWLQSFIKNSQAMIQSGDPIAVQVYEENNKAIMPAFTQLSDGEINGIIDYISNWKPQETVAVKVDINKKTGFTEAEFLRGQRLFHGLIDLENGGRFNCTNCHNTVTSDSLNWNPSAIDLAQAFMDTSGNNIYQTLAQPVSDLMQKAHQGMKFSEQEIYYISAYLAHISQDQLEPHRTFPFKLMLFLVFGLLMTLAIIDLLFTRRIKYRIIHVIVLIAGFSTHTYLAVIEAQSLSRTEGYAPDQPIKFSHQIHAGNNKTECLYCHHEADNSKSAGIPSVSTCMNCHNVVKTGTNSGNFEINKITRALNSGRPIEWIRIHNLPDHAYFNHSQHFVVGKVECQTCHGQVEKMHILKQESNLSMGWCVNCHRDTKVDFEGNKYYTTFKGHNNNFKSGKKEEEPHVDDVGGIDCSKCHY